MYSINVTNIHFIDSNVSDNLVCDSHVSGSNFGDSHVSFTVLTWNYSDYIFQ